jgi:hypothetical protein
MNVSVLVTARDEYIKQLKYILSPLIIQGFNSIYDDARKISNDKHVILQFQELLEAIKTWNQTILQDEAKRIKKKYPYIMNIITAIFVSTVKILASVRLKDKKSNINIVIPTSDYFFHAIYMEAASQIWYDPYIFYHGNHKKKPPSQQLCKQAIQLIISDSIDRAFRKLLPIEEILQEYLANALNDDADSDLDDIESKSGSGSGSGSSGSNSGSEPSYSDFDSDSENEIDADPESAQGQFQGQFQGQDQGQFQDPLSLQNEVKTFNFGNPPGQQYIPPVPQQPVPQQVPQQVTTFDQLGGYPQAGGHHDSSDSDSDSSESDSDSDSEHRPQHRPPPQQQQQQPYPGNSRDSGNNQGSREQKSYSFF